MSYTPLTDPFTIEFQKDGTSYEATVVYVKSSENCANFFDVHITTPSDMSTFYLKEKPILTPDFEFMVWVDDADKQNSLYQEIGQAIEEQLKEKEGIYLMHVG